MILNKNGRFVNLKRWYAYEWLKHFASYSISLNEKQHSLRYIQAHYPTNVKQPYFIYPGIHYNRVYIISLLSQNQCTRNADSIIPLQKVSVYSFRLTSR